MLNSEDLRHLTAVRIEQRNKFAEENQMASFLMSAKSGDQVKQAFYKIACNLAGNIVMSRNIFQHLLVPYSRPSRTIILSVCNL